VRRCDKLVRLVEKENADAEQQALRTAAAAPTPSGHQRALDVRPPCEPVVAVL
jgi:hypothetical protein